MSWFVASVFALTVAASAKDPRVYVNGERADGLRDVVLEEVDVRIDDRGNIWITAPQYKVGGAEGQSAHEPAPEGRYWLAVQDNASSNLTITVTINGRVATTVRSGQGGGVLDIGPWLHRGANQIELASAASKVAKGGPLVVQIGEGSAGTQLDSVAVSFARDPAASTKATERAFVLRVP